MTADTVEKIRSILQRHLSGLSPTDPLPDDQPLAELGLTSLGSVDLVLDLEEGLGILFPDELLTQETFRTAASLTSTLDRLAARTA